MGGKNSTSTSQVSVPPEILNRYNAVNDRAEQAATQQFQPYNGQFVAGLTGTQQAAIQNTNSAAGAAQPYIDAGANLSLGSAVDLRPDEYSENSVNKYMSPYLDDVYKTTAANIDRSNQVQQQNMLGDQIKANAFGGDRAGIARAELARTQNLAGQQTLAGILQQGFGQAQNEFNNQQTIGLGAQQNTAARMAAAGQQIGALGVQGQQASLAGAAAQMQAGQVEQGTQQADLTAQYNQFLQGKSYPFQVAQFLANIAEGTGSLSGSTTTSTSPAPFFSDARLKENMTPIGETFDGQPIYRYNYTGDNRTQIGLVAQDVAHAHPDAVGADRGYLTVDYDKATRKAAGLGAAAHHGQQGLAGGGVAGPYQAMSGGSQYPTPMSYVPQANLPVAGLAVAKTPDQKQSSGLADMAKNATAASSLIKDGKSAYDWFKSKPGDGEDTHGMYADGGEVDDPDYPNAPMAGTAPNVHSYVPKADLPVAGLKPAETKGAGGSGGLGDVASLIGSASKILPFFMASNGGAIGHYAAGGAPEIDPDELAARVAYREAAGEPDDGVAGVFHVMRNRVNAGGYGDGLAGVLSRPKQFSPMNNYGTGAKDDPATVDVNSPAFQRIRAIQARINAGEIPDPTGGALNFANVDTVHRTNPNNRWVDNMQNPVAIGRHTFGTAGAGRDSGLAAIARQAPQEGSSARAYTDEPRPLSVRKAFPSAPQPQPGLAAAAPPDEGGFLAQAVKKVGGMDDNMKLSLLSGLFGMLSSKSHWLLPAIGEGGLSAINTYQDLRKNDASIEHTNAQASLTRANALGASIIFDKDHNPIAVLAGGTVIPYGQWLKDQKALTGAVPAGTVVGDTMRASGRTPAAPIAGDIPPGGNGQPESRGQRPGPPVAGSAATANELTVPRTAPVETKPLAAPRSSTPVPATQVKPPPPIADLPPAMAAAAQEERDRMGDGNDANRVDAAKKIVAESQEAAEAHRQSTNLQHDLALSVSSAPKGGWAAQGTGAGTRYGAAKAVNTLTNILGLGDAVDPNTLKWKDINEKLSTLNASNLKGGMTAQGALEMFKHTQPNMEMTPETAATMVAQLYRMRQRAIDRANTASSYTSASGGKGLEFDKTFNKEFSQETYEKEAKAIERMMLGREKKSGRTMMDLYLNGQLSPETLKAYEQREGVPNLHRYFSAGTRN